MKVRPFPTTRVLAIAVLLLLGFSAPLRSESVYYSIHLDTFKTLKDVNRQVNSLKEKGKVVFWEKTEVQGMGRQYRVYVGRYEDWQTAVRYWKRLKAMGAVEHFGIHWFPETELPVPDTGQTAALSKSPARPPDKKIRLDPKRFVDNQDGTITDTETRLMWIKNGWRLEFLSAATWADAMEKTKKFTYGGHTDWRLPSIDEWLSVIDPDNHNPALVDPNPFENIISHMPYWSRSEYQYSSNLTCKDQCPIESYTVMLFSGSINHLKKSERAFILPVRSIQ